MARSKRRTVITPHEKSELQARRKAIDDELVDLLEEQQKLDDRLRGAEPKIVTEEELIAKSQDKLQRFLQKCSEVSRDMRDSEARTYFRKLIKIGESIMLDRDRWK